mgnify:CR=1 FL=1
MPGFDGTGPRGQGPMTGGGRGYCVVDMTRAVPLRGCGRGFFRGGLGRGFRNRYYAGFYSGRMPEDASWQEFYGAGRQFTKEEELSILKREADLLKEELDAVQARMKEMEIK